MVVHKQYHVTIYKDKNNALYLYNTNPVNSKELI